MFEVHVVAKTTIVLRRLNILIQGQRVGIISSPVSLLIYETIYILYNL